METITIKPRNASEAQSVVEFLRSKDILYQTNLRKQNRRALIASIEEATPESYKTFTFEEFEGFVDTEIAKRKDR